MFAFAGLQLAENVCDSGVQAHRVKVEIAEELAAPDHFFEVEEDESVIEIPDRKLADVAHHAGARVVVGRDALVEGRRLLVRLLHFLGHVRYQRFRRIAAVRHRLR